MQLFTRLDHTPLIAAAEASSVALHVQTACIWEVLSRKLGNVHRYQDFADTTLADFLLSAAACAGPLSQSTLPLGQRIYQAVAATRRIVRVNTNLGIILLLAPLTGLDYSSRWENELGKVLQAADLADARDVYAAIRLAQPSGLGQVPREDVRGEPTLRLQQVMALAADYDLIARQYVTDYADVRQFGLPVLIEAWERWGCVEAAVLECQLHWLAQYGDSAIARKNGPAAAQWVQQQAQEVLNLGGLSSAAGRRAAAQLDRRLRLPDNRFNPGTTADLITACLFVALRTQVLRPDSPFVWAQSLGVELASL
ncbi:MAG: triphosphoribosyl-dephospho-CoA synthase [Thermogemmata sp.]|uniref:Triphosphoribosyl-dephospho-CoA synthase n=1 Tax=Thermogemmata fonticola TaxID=2755323 RepID=A0A7V9AAK8_9BACT|nr:triphosphoribosyl-dephospho-CoA synthase [Thermogemmata fonticola]MBA2225143.1 triphosphoribosyl-dephospho-CoA synthase [Thermogemmata fonticola]MCX8139695.1 triphosphoribosyl-dephospho-CoA synthase [Gemmataceae bacterium]